MRDTEVTTEAVLDPRVWSSLPSRSQTLAVVEAPTALACPTRSGRSGAVARRRVQRRWTFERRQQPGRAVPPGCGGYSRGRGSACHRALSRSGR